MSSSDLFKIGKNLVKNGTLGGKYRYNWAEESFDIEGEKQARLGIGHTRRFLGVGISKRALFIFAIFIAFISLIIFGRIIYLQVGKGSFYRTLAEGNRNRLERITPERGIIYDVSGKQLVSNIPNFSLVFVPRDLPRNQTERYSLIEKVSSMSGITVTDLLALISEASPYGSEPIVLKENIDYESALALYVANADLPGISIISGMRRHYGLINSSISSSTLSLSHILGYTGKLSPQELKDLSSEGYVPTDKIGKSGIEKMYEDDLRGVYGRKRVEVDAFGKERTVLAVDPPQPGKNVYLTIDIEAQSVLERLIKQSSEKTGRRKFAAIAMNPQNGHILAMVSWPAFDNNEFANGIRQQTYSAYISDPDQPLFNRVIAGTFPSGSTAKLVVAAAALEEKVITQNTVFNSVGGLHVGKWYFKDWKAGGHGITNVTKALAWSVNTFFYYVGGGYDSFVGLGFDRLKHYMSLFNISQKTGIDLPGESSGFLPTKEWKQKTKGEQWYVGDTYNLSIGQGDLLVTPLQVAIWTAAIANGGKVMWPHIINKIVDPTTQKETVVSDVTLRKDFVSPSNIAIVQRGLRACVTDGSCKLLGTLPFLAAGKTGTAQWNSTKPTHAWFTSFAPFDKPQIVVTILAEEGGEGATAAMPIARDFLAWWGKKYLSL